MNIKRFSNFPQSIDPVKSQTILEQFLELNNNFGVLNENLQDIDANFEQVQEEFATLENEFATLENEFAETQRKVNSLESEIGTLPAQVAQNTSDIAELKQREDKQGTIVKVNGQAVAQWSPDTMSTDIATNRDNIQQVTQAQASDSLAIVGLQSDNITNKQNISNLQTSVSNLDSDNTTNKSNISALQTNVSDLQGDVTTLNQQQARSLKTPTTAPTETELVGVDSTNSQVLIPLSQIGGGGGELKSQVVTSPSELLQVLQSKYDKIKYIDINETTSTIRYCDSYTSIRMKSGGTITNPTASIAVIMATPRRFYLSQGGRTSTDKLWYFATNWCDQYWNTQFGLYINSTTLYFVATQVLPLADSLTAHRGQLTITSFNNLHVKVFYYE